jgi:hypothetical protein
MTKSPSRKCSLENDLRKVLNWLCVEWGFCIPPKDRNRIANSHHLDAGKFAAEVLIAEGLDPELEREWFRKIRSRFVEQFGETVSVENYSTRAS